MPSNVRGVVLKAPDSTPGIVFVNGQQKPFSLAGVWQSPVAPTPNLAVDIDMTEEGEVTGIRIVPDSQLAKEQTAVLVDAANAKGKQVVAMALDRVGKWPLIALGVLIASWFLLDWVSFHLDIFFQKLVFHASYWKTIGWLNFAQNQMDNPGQLLSSLRDGDPSQGIYGLLCVIALAGPLLPVVWKDKKASLGGVLPLLFMLFIGFQWYRLVSEAMDALGLSNAPHRGFGGGTAPSKGFSDVCTLGSGFYLSLASAIYLAANSFLSWLRTKSLSNMPVAVSASPVSQPIAYQPAPHPVSIPTQPVKPAVLTCRYCSAVLEDGSLFCDSCGKPQS